jgi:hypothetical protein
LLKSSASVEVFTAIEQVLAGKTYVTPLVTKACLSVIGAAWPREVGHEQSRCGDTAGKGSVDEFAGSLVSLAFRAWFLACFAAQGIARWSHRRSYALEHGMLKKHTSAYTCYLLVLTVSEVFSVSYDGRR